MNLLLIVMQQLNQHIWRWLIVDTVPCFSPTETNELNNGAINQTYNMLTNRLARLGLTKWFVNILSDHKRNPRYERQDRVTFHILVPNPEFVDLAVGDTDS